MRWFSIRRRPKLPDEAYDQLRSILDNYDRLSNQPLAQTGCDAQIVRLRAALKEDPEGIWWSDIAIAELCLLDRLRPEQIRARLSGWRRRFREVAGDARYAQYLAAAPDTATEPDVEKLRADLGECIRAVYYFYGAYGVAARSRMSVTTWLIRAAALFLSIEAIVALVLTWHDKSGHAVITLAASARVHIWWALATSACAIVGSVISVQRRLQDPTVEVDPFYRFIQTNADWFGVAVVSPLFAALFGALIYGLLVSKILSTSLIAFDDGTPSTAAAKAAILIFGFIAGFAEQLIPDALTRFATGMLARIGTSNSDSGHPNQSIPANAPSKGADAPASVSRTESHVDVVTHASVDKGAGDSEGGSADRSTGDSGSGASSNDPKSDLSGKDE